MVAHKLVRQNFLPYFRTPETYRSYLHELSGTILSVHYTKYAVLGSCTDDLKKKHGTVKTWGGGGGGGGGACLGYYHKQLCLF